MRTDLYALGCLAYTLVAGQAPFARSTLMDTLLAHKTDPMPQVEERYALPNGFDDWLYRMTAKSWNQRFHRASEALRYLESLGGSSHRLMPIPVAHQSLDAASSNLEPVDATLLSPTPVVSNEMASLENGLPSVNRAHLSFDIRRDASLKTETGRVLSADLVAFEDCQLVGRDAEQAAIWSAFQAAMETNETRMVEICSTAGMGKTSLADWFATQAHETVDAETVWVSHNPLNGRCDGLTGFLFSYFSLFKRDSEAFNRHIAERLARPEDEPLSMRLAEIAELQEFGTSRWMAARICRWKIYISPLSTCFPIWHRNVPWLS